MRNRFKKAFDKVSLDNTEKNQIIENVVNNRSIMKEKRNFWQGKYGGIATVCAALIVFVLVNAAIFGGMKKGSPASDIPESETTESMSSEELIAENATIVAGEEPTTAGETPTGQEPTGEDVTAAENEPTEKGITEEPELKAAEELQTELKNILAQTESGSSLDVSGETQERLFELLADYLPLKNAALTAGTGARWGSEHSGIDMATDDAEPVIYAVMDGTVLEYGWANMKGLRLVIDNGNGVITEYCHLKESLVSAGDVLSAGTPAAVMGNTGASTGPHLHWEMTVNGELVNPLCYAAEHLELFRRD